MKIRVTIERISDNNEVVRKVMTTNEEDVEDECQMNSKSLGEVVGEAIQMFAYPRTDEVIANAVSLCGLDKINWPSKPISKEEIACLVDAAEEIVSKWEEHDEEFNEMVNMIHSSDN